MNTSQLISKISDKIKDANTLKPFNEKVFKELSLAESNEFLCFIKPEITIQKKGVKLSEILNLIFQKFSEFTFSAKSVRIVNAEYLNRHGIISMHYGVINRISSNIRKYITTEGKKKFEEIYGEPFENASIYGSIEFLKKYPMISPTGLSMLWQNATFEKLAGGTYSTKLKFDGNFFYLVNGFHPRQLEHFTTPGKSIVVITLTSETDWSVARNKLIGATVPSDAAKGSIRKELLENKDFYGLEEVSASWNGIHLSAGPIEGLIELMRYNSDFDNNICQTPEDYQLGRNLLKELGTETTAKILRNPVVEYKGKKESVFDLTEEMNTQEAIEALKSIKFID